MRCFVVLLELLSLVLGCGLRFRFELYCTDLLIVVGLMFGYLVRMWG